VRSLAREPHLSSFIRHGSKVREGSVAPTAIFHAGEGGWIRFFYSACVAQFVLQSSQVGAAAACGESERESPFISDERERVSRGEGCNELSPP